MTIVRAIEPLSLRFPGINLDSTPDLQELPLEKITAPTLIISARDDLFNTLRAAEFVASKIRSEQIASGISVTAVRQQGERRLRLLRKQLSRAKCRCRSLTQADSPLCARLRAAGANVNDK